MKTELKRKKKTPVSQNRYEFIKQNRPPKKLCYIVLLGLE